MDVDTEFHSLGAIRVDPPRRPLGLEQMFHRATRWRTAPHPVPATPSPVPEAEAGSLVLPLPAPGVSPLAELFTYPELVPLVLEELSRPAHLAAAARVCKYWNHVARRRLYADVWVRPWEAAPKEKLLGLFESFDANPDLCPLVRSLDIRFFPLDMQGDALLHLEDAVVLALSRMANLTRLVWTRDRSISSELFGAITALPCLTNLELSGHATRQYEPHLLGGMPRLADLRVMMPDATFRSALPDVIRRLDGRPSGGLTGLALVCKSQNLINDGMLVEIAPHLTQLKRLTLIGGTRITKLGVYALMESAEGIQELVLDATQYSDLLDLSDAPTCTGLSTFSLSFPAPKAREDLTAEDMPRFPLQLDLRALELTLSNTQGSGQRQRLLSTPALATLTSQVDFSRLSRLALINLVLDTPVLAAVLAAAPGLEELYVSVLTPRVLAACAAGITAPLRILHANSAPDPLGREVLAGVAGQIPTLTQIGSMNRVFEVHRRYVAGKSVVELARWSQVQTAGYFRVWRP